MRCSIQLAERPHIVPIRASFKSLLIESEAQQSPSPRSKEAMAGIFTDVKRSNESSPQLRAAGSVREPHDPSHRIKRRASLNRFCGNKLSDGAEFSVPVFTGIVVIATGEVDEHARLIAHRPRIVTRWQQHDIVL